MKTYLNKVASSAAGVGLFLAGCVMAALGLSMMVFLALFGLAILGLGILTAPLLTLMQSAKAKGAEGSAA